MGSKVHPYGFRIGKTMDWFNSWYGDKQTYPEYVSTYLNLEREWKKIVESNLYANYKVQITSSEILIVVNTHKPSLIIGLKGAKVNKIQEDLTNRLKRKVSVKINEVKPELTPEVICEMLSEALIAKKDHKFIMKNCGKSAMQSGACKGIFMNCEGRIRGATIARADKKKFGSIPLQTIDANIAVAQKQVLTKSGACGVKVVMCYHNKDDVNVNFVKRGDNQDRFRRGGNFQRRGNNQSGQGGQDGQRFNQNRRPYGRQSENRSNNGERAPRSQAPEKKQEVEQRS